MRFLFDNNFFWALCKDRTGKKISCFNEALAKTKVISGRVNVEFLFSPFTLLESIGSPHRGIPSPRTEPKPHLLTSKMIPELFAELYEQAYDYYSHHPSISCEVIKEKVAEQRNYGSSFGRDFFEKVIAHNTKREGFESSIYSALALDFIQTYQYPPHLQDDVITTFIDHIVRMPSHGLNVSWARVIDPAWKRNADDFERHGLISKADRRKVRDEDYCFKRTTDMVDTEVTHYATVGWYFESQLHPVVCFTSDLVSEKIKFRIGLYKFLAGQIETFLTDKEKAGNALPFKRIPLAAGRVAICDQQSGDILEVISVIDIAERGVIEI